VIGSRGPSRSPSPPPCPTSIVDTLDRLHSRLAAAVDRADLAEIDAVQADVGDALTRAARAGADERALLAARGMATAARWELAGVRRAPV
jgi:hypothetical protein